VIDHERGNALTADHQRDPADDQRKCDRHAQRHGAEQREGEDGERHARSPR
jgi:hypothetical protein